MSSRPLWIVTPLLLLLLAASISSPAQACPFCSAVSLTFSEEIGNSDAAVIATLVERPPVAPDAGAVDAAASKAKFKIVEVLKGAAHLGKAQTLQTIYFGDNPVGTTFLVMGVEPPAINWSTPIAITARGRSYLAKALKLPKEGFERLVFFQDYLEDPEDMLGRDAYDEFAKAPYSAVKALKEHMHHDKLVSWIKNPQIPTSRRRLYLTLLAVCGKPQDADMLEAMMRSEDRQARSGLDALVAAYLTLKGPGGMDLVEDLFLKNKQAEYTDTYAAIMALRFHGQEEKVVPRPRLIQGIRHMLDRPQLADLVIPDLARWEDWDSLERMVALFKNADDESSWVRVPVINYLRVCPLPKAKTYIDELAKIDPEVVKRADTLLMFGGALAPAAATRDGDKKLPPKATDDVDVRGSKPAEQKQTPAATSGRDTKKQTSAPAPAPHVATKLPADQQQAAAPPTRLAASGLPISAHTGRAAADPTATFKVMAVMAAAGIVLFLAFLLILRGGRSANVPIETSRQS